MTKSWLKLAGLLALFLNPFTAHACSPDFSPLIELASKDEILPNNAVIRSWSYARNIISARLVNQQGQSVPADLVTAQIPTPVFLDMRTYAELRPFAPLAAGKYQLFMETDMGRIYEPVTFNVGTDSNTEAPTGPTSVTASLKTLPLPVRINSDCTPIMGERRCVLLTMQPALTVPQFSDEPGEKQVFELSWVPVRKGIRDEKRFQINTGMHTNWSWLTYEKATQPDTNSLIIPVNWFKSLRATDTEVEFRIVAVDRCGNKSAAVNTRLSAVELRAAILSNVEKPGMDVPMDGVAVDKLRASDLVRFQKAAGSPEARKFLEMLQPTRENEVVSPEIKVSEDAAFRRSILSTNGTVPLFATIYKQVPISVALFVEVKAGRIHPQIS
ncbi:MAG: hypothetical protein EOP09_02105, partial [Proteobacteria bacterium]